MRLAVAVITRVRAMLLGVLITATLLWALAAALVSGPLGALAIGAVVLWRGRRVWSTARLALWVEEQTPDLHYALVTAVDPRCASDRENVARIASIDSVLAARPLSRVVIRRATRSLTPALLASGLAFTIRAALPVTTFLPGPGPMAQRPSRLAPLSAIVTPPAYTRWSTTTLEEPSTVSALVGSRIVFEGRRDGTGILVTIGAEPIPVTSSTDRWRVALNMPMSPVAMRLVDRQYTRLVVLQPIPDAPPTVVLTAPAHDTTVREPAQDVLTLTAEGADDIGLEEGWFEYLISSGEEESGGVHGREVRVGRTTFGNARTGALHATLGLDALGLKGGDLLSVRAVVVDGNAGQGTSETRTMRVATKQEYDSLAVNAAPPPGVDSAYMSQLMIVLATRKLIARHHQRHPPLRDTLIDVSYRLANKERALNQRITTILYGGGSDGGEGETIPAWEQALFDTASRALTDAETALEIAQPDTALGPELVALHALDKARQAMRLYLRGAPPAIVVNVDRVRMTGKEKPDAGFRIAGSAVDTLWPRLVPRLVAAAMSVRAAHASAVWQAGVDSLTLLRVAALRSGANGNAPLAAALNDALNALAERRDATRALARARQAMIGSPVARGSLSSWSDP